MTNKNNKGRDITFFHPDLLEVPENEPPYLKGYKCKHCNKIWFPKFLSCPDPDCWCEEMDIVPLSRSGIVYSVTDVFVGQPTMKEYMPLTLAYVDLPEGIRVFAQLEGELGTFTCGDRVELSIGPVRNNKGGEPIISFKFKRAVDFRRDCDG